MDGASLFAQVEIREDLTWCERKRGQQPDDDGGGF